MIKRISKTEEFKTKIKAENKVSSLNEVRHISAITSMNERLEVVRREYQVKDRNSQMTASTVILTA
jgi:hypothetical protein